MADDITADTAKALVLERYEALFKSSRLVNRGDNSSFPYPPLTKESLQVEGPENGAFRVIHNVPAGLELEARVSTDGKWVDLIRVAWVSE